MELEDEADGAVAELRQAGTGHRRELLADEPTGNLDSATSAQIHDLFFTINKQRGTTIVLVTHNLALAKGTPRVVTLKDGRVEKDERRAGTALAAELDAAG